MLADNYQIPRHFAGTRDKDRAIDAPWHTTELLATMGLVYFDVV